MAPTNATATTGGSRPSFRPSFSSWSPATNKISVQESPSFPKPSDDGGESSPAGIAAVSSASNPPQPSSAPSSSMQDELKQKSKTHANETSETMKVPMKDPDINNRSTSEVSRCRHLEEQMFPRVLSLDCKQMDDFCIRCVKDQRNKKDLGRIYIEALHLQDFLKSPETIISQNTIAQTKGRGKRGRGNIESSSKKKNRSSPTKRNSDEQVTDNGRLSQAYFGGLEGKRSWFLANSHTVGKGGGVAGSYCQVLPSTTLDSIGTEDDSNFLKKSVKKSKKGVSPSVERLDNLLLSEIKLASLRRAMRLHDHTVPFVSAEDAHSELTALENLVKPLPGYTPPSVDPSGGGNASSIAAEPKASVGAKVSKAEPIAVPSAAADTPTSLPLVRSQSMEIDIKGKDNPHRKESDESMVPGPTLSSNDNVGSSATVVAPETPLSSASISSPKEGSPSNKHIARVEHISISPESNFARAMREGKEASLASNMLLESFRRNRRSVRAQKLNGEALKCVWCPPSATEKNKINTEFGVINDSIVSGNTDECTVGRHCGATGDALIQCLECDVVGCNQHAMLHFLMSGHRFGVTCGPLGEIFCMGCGDKVYHECFDHERERLFLEQNIPSLSWPETPILRGVDPSSFIVTPENGVVWCGMTATYPTPVSTQLVQASRFAARRISIFRGDAVDRSMGQGLKAVELSRYQKQHLEDRWITRPIGMYNLGNTCFMSATLQCLIHCKPLQDLFLRNLAHPYQSCYALRCGSNKSSCLTCELDKILLEYYGSGIGIDAIASLEEQLHLSPDATPTDTKKETSGNCGHPIIPSSLLAEVWRDGSMKQVAGHGQHDAQEFFNAFVDCLATHALAYQKSAQDMRQMHETQIKQSRLDNPGAKSVADFVSNMFMGTLRSVLICQKCGCKRTQTESFSNVSLPLAKGLSTSSTESKSSTRRGKMSVRSVLNHFTLPETLADTVYCPSCNSKTKTLMQHTFSKLPEVLCLHLKRFDSAGNKKISDFVAFPASLDMGRHLPHWCERGLEAKKKNNGEHSAGSPKVLYDLFATVNHKGTLHQGHYIANVKNGNRWYSCNDAFVTTAGEGDGEKEVLSSDGAYMLFYLKR